MKLTVKTLVVNLFVCVFCVSAFAVDEVSEPFEGVTYIHRNVTQPRLLDIHIVKIDLSANGISFKVSPHNGTAPGDTNLQTSRAFLEQEGAQIAVNGSFFYVGNGVDILGYAASNGFTYSGFEARFHYPQPHCALNISETNKADIITPPPAYPTGLWHFPTSVQVHNALMGSEWIVRDGVNVTTSDLDINQGRHPRTAAGITADNKLILFVVDGRQSHSLGMYTTEVADMLISLGAVQGINLDGGGSSTMVFADPYPRVINSPSDGSERAVGNSLAVFANYIEQPLENYVFADFENGNEATFSLSPGYSGSTEGIATSQSTADAVNTEAKSGSWSQKIFIKDDPAVSSASDYPQYGWMVRHVSGSHASPSQNVSRPTQGYLGYWLKTSTPNLAASIVIDDGSQMERGILVALIDDGNWHYYEWNLDDNSNWYGWINGNGSIDSQNFTIDSIQLFGPNADALVYIDDVMHNPFESIATPYSCQDVWDNGLGMAGDFNKDCFCNFDDLFVLADYWLLNEPSDGSLQFDGDGFVDVCDFVNLSKDWQTSNLPEPQQEQ